MKQLFSINTFLLLVFSAFSQSQPAKIEGKITDAKSGDEMLFATVELYKPNKKTPLSSAISDFNGYYSISNLDIGTYDLEISYTGYTSKRIENIVIHSGEVVQTDVQINLKTEGQTDSIQIELYTPSSNQKVYDRTGGNRITPEEIAKLPKVYFKPRTLQPKQRRCLFRRKLKNNTKTN